MSGKFLLREHPLAALATGGSVMYTVATIICKHPRYVAPLGVCGVAIKQLARRLMRERYLSVLTFGGICYGLYKWEMHLMGSNRVAIRKLEPRNPISNTADIDAIRDIVRRRLQVTPPPRPQLLITWYQPEHATLFFGSHALTKFPVFEGGLTTPMDAMVPVSMKYDFDLPLVIAETVQIEATSAISAPLLLTWYRPEHGTIYLGGRNLTTFPQFEGGVPSSMDLSILVEIKHNFRQRLQVTPPPRPQLLLTWYSPEDATLEFCSPGHTESPVFDGSISSPVDIMVPVDIKYEFSLPLVITETVQPEATSVSSESDMAYESSSEVSSKAGMTIEGCNFQAHNLACLPEKAYPWEPVNPDSIFDTNTRLFRRDQKLQRYYQDLEAQLRIGESSSDGSFERETPGITPKEGPLRKYEPLFPVDLDYKISRRAVRDEDNILRPAALLPVCLMNDTEKAKVAWDYHAQIDYRDLRQGEENILPVNDEIRELFAHNGIPMPHGYKWVEFLGAMKARLGNDTSKDRDMAVSEKEKRAWAKIPVHDFWAEGFGGYRPLYEPVPDYFHEKLGDGLGEDVDSGEYWIEEEDLEQQHPFSNTQPTQDDLMYLVLKKLEPRSREEVEEAYRFQLMDKEERDALNQRLLALRKGEFIDDFSNNPNVAGPSMRPPPGLSQPSANNLARLHDLAWQSEERSSNYHGAFTTMRPPPGFPNLNTGNLGRLHGLIQQPEELNNGNAGPATYMRPPPGLSRPSPENLNRLHQLNQQPQDPGNMKNGAGTNGKLHPLKRPLPELPDPSTDNVNRFFELIRKSQKPVKKECPTAKRSYRLLQPIQAPRPHENVAW
jgi:hypothetical protein